MATRRRAPAFLAGLCVLAWMALLPGVATATTGPSGGTVIVTRVDGVITPVVADHLRDGVRRAERDGHDAFLVELDTPGGLDTSMREIIKAFLGARVPVIVYVSPSGGRAASAGALITFSAHVAAMAPGTTIGAATPVDLQGGKISPKIINDAAAFAMTVAKERGRNVAFAEDTVRKGRAATADEALRLGAVDLIARDRGQLLDALDGREVRLANGTATLRTANAQLVRYDFSLTRRLLQILADPNLAFLFLSLGTLAIIYEMANPGHAVGGITGTILLVLGFFALSVLPVNVAGLALLALSAGLFAAELYAPGIGVFAVGGTVSLILAGVFLFEGSLGVSPAVLWPTAVIVGGGSLVAGRLTWRARRARPVTGTDLLVGQRTVVRTATGDTGRVLLEGAWWTTRSISGPLHEGQDVRVTAVDGLTLVVEPVQPTKEST